MCRLFGFRSVIPSQVHESLVSAENALVVQSEGHPDGWGVAYYVHSVPHVVKSADGAVSDALFKHLSGVVSSETVIAHVRKATAGNLSLINSHPFQYGKWIFCHNGDIPNFAEHRDELVSSIPAVMRRFILGETDSEVIFYLLLSRMAQRFDLQRKGYPVDELTAAIRETVELVSEVVGLDCYDADNKHFLTFLVTNGETMAAHNGGKELYLSTHKRRCSERDRCASFAPACEKISPSGFVTHLIFCSEPLQGENVWLETLPGQIVGVDWRMKIYNDGGAPLTELREHLLQKKSA